MDLIPLMSPTDVAVIIMQDGGTFSFSSKVADVLLMMIEDELEVMEDDDATQVGPELARLGEFIRTHSERPMCTGMPADPDA